jgi:ATP-dependent DNA helicase PIF1
MDPKKSMYQSMQALKQNPETENLGKKWSEEEINDLLSAIKDGSSLDELAVEHKRTINSIRTKLLNIADHYITNKKMDVNEVSKIVKMPVIKINEFLLKKLPKKESTLEKEYMNLKKIESKLVEEVNNLDNRPIKEIKLNIEQQLALDEFKTGKNIFLTGPAGTGKSVTLKKIIEHCELHGLKYGVTATTGTASFLIGGKTLHSYLGLGLAKESAEEIFKFVRYKLKHVADKIRTLNVLIIDEISMLDKELLEKISAYICLLRRNSVPFGGIQIVLTGDFCQLEPVNGEYCFLSDLWKTINLKTIYLHKLVRQDGDTEFQKMLSKLRYGKCTEKIYQRLLSLKNTEFGDVKPTKLYPKNVNVDKINTLEYNKLIESGAKMIKYTAILPTKAKDKEKATKWINSLELPESVEICIGAQVVLLVNLDQDNGLVNGTRGVVIDVLSKSVLIKRVNNTICEIPLYKTTNSEDDSLSVSYMPLKLAYALTIHRSQGMTLDAVEIDIGTNIFAAGQAYTALSRAQNLKSVRIVAVAKNSFIVNPKVLEFYEKIEDDLKERNILFVNETLCMMVYNIANHIDLEKSLDFIWEFIDESNEEIADYFDNYKNTKLKLDYMDYSSYKGTEEINTLIKMVYTTKENMINDVELVKDKRSEF